MSHTVAEKKKLLMRVRRLKGQVEAVERALESEAGCTPVMHLIAACRGAINGLIAEVMEDHIRLHVVSPGESEANSQAAEELIDIIHSYVK
jgi:FrmR/RcnR family transcriptional regulator, repressor of frmRAB operon